jgi:hypothetical protein
MKPNTTPAIPPQIMAEYKKYVSQKYQYASIVYDYSKDEFFVGVIPQGWCKPNIFLETVK